MDVDVSLDSLAIASEQEVETNVSPGQGAGTSGEQGDTGSSPTSPEPCSDSPSDVDYQSRSVKPAEKNTLGRLIFKQTETGEFCDVRLKLEGHELWGHSCVLVVRSQYFARLLGGSFAPVDKNNVDVSDIFLSVDAAKSIHRFLYLSELEITGSNYREILHSSSMLLVEDLTSAIEQFLVDNLVFGNCLAFHVLAQRYQLEDLSKKATDMIRGRVADLFPFCGIIQKAELEEIECLFERGLDLHSSVPGLAHMVLAWFNADRSERYDGAKALLSRIKRPSYGLSIFHSVAQLDSDDEEASLLQHLDWRAPMVGSGDMETTKEEEVVILFSLSSLPGTDSESDSFKYSTYAYIRSTDEWLQFPSSVVKKSILPVDYNQYSLGFHLAPVGVYHSYMVFALTKVNSDYLMIHDLTTQTVKFVAGVKGTTSRYFLVHCVILTTTSEVIDDVTWLTVRQLNFSGPNSSLAWRVIGMIPGDSQVEGNRKDTQIHVAPALDPNSVVVFQVSTVSVPSAPDSSRSCRIRVSGHEFNCKDGSSQELRKKPELSAPTSHGWSAWSSGHKVYFCIRHYQTPECHIAVYDMVEDTWTDITGRTTPTKALDEFSVSSTRQHALTYSVAGPGSQYKISQGKSEAISQLCRLDIETGVMAVLAPPPVLPNIPNQNACAGMVSARLLSRLKLARSTLEETEIQKQPGAYCARVNLTKKFENSGLLMEEMEDSYNEEGYSDPGSGCYRVPFEFSDYDDYGGMPGYDDSDNPYDDYFDYDDPDDFLS